MKGISTFFSSFMLLPYTMLQVFLENEGVLKKILFFQEQHKTCIFFLLFLENGRRIFFLLFLENIGIFLYSLVFQKTQQNLKKN